MLCIDANIILRYILFVDCILAGYCERENTNVQTFDKKLDKLLTIITKTKN